MAGLNQRGAPESAIGVPRPGDKTSEELAQSPAERSRTPSATGGREPPASSDPPSKVTRDRRSPSFSGRIGSLVRAIEDNDEAKIEEAILRLSRSRRVFAPLALAVGAFV